MTGERVVRRPAAILAADVVGYSRLMGRDENGTLAFEDLGRLALKNIERPVQAYSRLTGRKEVGTLARLRERC